MPTRREYLAGLNPPLAKANSRGRLSKAALAEIERARASGVTFTDEEGGSADAEPTPSLPGYDEPPRPSLVRPNPIQREIGTVTGYTLEGTLVQSAVCFKCSNHVNRCACQAGIKASSIIARWSDESLPYGAPIDLTLQS